MAGRPTKYNDKLANRILNLYASGMNLFRIEKQKGAPSRRTVLRWRKQFPAFATEYDIASECNTDQRIESVIDRIDRCTDPKLAKLLDILFKSTSWYVGKINRAKYGDKLDITQTVLMDISPALLEATNRMQAVGVGTPQVIEAHAKQLSSKS